MPDPRIPTHDPDRRVGPYLLAELIGSGGVGEVWRAWDPRLQRWVAVKRLREKMGSQTIQRFQREARIAAALRHPNVVTVYEFGEHDGRPYLAMELLEGGPLDLKRPLKETVARLSKVARALHQAHLQGAVHRDLKPGNIVLDARGEPRIVDFGLAHLDEGGDRRLTRSGAMLGTPLYMAPEQVEGRVKDVGPRSDVYGLGAILYEAMARRPIFQGANLATLYDRILRKDPAIPPGPRDLAFVCLKSVSKRPADRYESAEALADDLDRWLGGEPVMASHPGLRRWVRARRRWIAIAAVLAVAIGAGALLVRGVTRASEERSKLEREKNALQRTKALDDLVRPVEHLMNETRLLWYVPGPDIFSRLDRVRVEVERLEREAAKPESAGHAGIWNSIASGRYLLGEFGASFEAAGRALAVDPSSARAHALQGRVLLERAFILAGHPGAAKHEGERSGERAIEAFRKAGSSWEGATDLDRHLATACLAYAREDFSEVRRLCAEGLDRFGETAGTEEYHLFLATLQQPKEGLPLLERAIQRRPHYPWALFARGNCRERMNDRKGAFEDYSALLKYWPHMADVHYARARLMADYDPATALPDYDAAIRLRPGMIDAQEGRIWCLLALGRLEEAERELKPGLDRNPRWSEGLSCRGRLEELRGNHAAALASYEAAIAADEANATARARRGCLLEVAGRHAEAAEEFRRAVFHRPERGDLHALLGQALADLGRNEEALAAFSEAAVRVTDDPAIFHNRGLVHRNLGRLREAEADFTMALSLNPRLFPSLTERALVRVRDGRLKDALADFQEVCRAKPDDPDARFNLAIILRDVGRPAEALQEVQRALGLGGGRWPNHHRAESLRDELRRSPENR